MNNLLVKKLMHVSVENGLTSQSNKYYNMFQENDQEFRVEYGRVGTPPKIERYPMSQWDKKYREKTGPKKNYKDVTDLFVENNIASVNNGVNIKNSVIKKLIDELMSFAKKTVQANYKVSQESVTQAMVDTAQNILNNIATQIKIGTDIKQLNKDLLQLFTVIPRKMKNVKDYILPEIINDKSLEYAQQVIQNEQSILDTLAGQVTLKQQNISTDNNTDTDFLTAMGLEIEEITASEEKMLKTMMDESKDKYRKAYKVINKKTQEKFDNHLKIVKNKKTELQFHGSRNENWMNILQTGLLIRPSGAVYTGSMYGDGIYAANKARKSINYTSLRGSYWAKGNENKAFLAVFDFHFGNQKHIHKHDSSCYSLNYEKLHREGFDSVFAHKGADLINDEFIVYKVEQCTIKYLIEIQ